MQAFLEVWETYMLLALFVHCFAFGLTLHGATSLADSFVEVCVGLELCCVSKNRCGVVSTQICTVTGFQHYPPHQIPGQNRSSFIFISWWYMNLFWFTLSAQMQHFEVQHQLIVLWRLKGLIYTFCCGYWVLSSWNLATWPGPLPPQVHPSGFYLPFASSWRLLVISHELSYSVSNPIAPCLSECFAASRFARCILIHTTRNGELTKILMETVIYTHDKKK